VTLFLDGGAEQVTHTAALGATAADTVATRFYPGPDGTTVTRSYDDGAAAATLTEQPGTPLGTVTESVTDNPGQVITRRYFDPYGNPAGSPVSWPDDLGYAGRPADLVTGLDLLGARQYDPATGRFLSLDPLFGAGSPQDMGGYSYAGDDPVSGSDPSGLSEGGSDPDPCGSAAAASCNAGGGGQAANGGTGAGDNTGTDGTGLAPGSPLLPPAAAGPYQSFYRRYAANSEASGGQLELGALDGFCAADESQCGAGLTGQVWAAYEAGKAPMGIFMDPGLNGGGDLGQIRSAAMQETDQYYLDRIEGQDPGGEAQYAAASCGGMSFSAATKVLLASGAAIPISKLTPGDEVLATNVRTGKTSPEPVTAVLLHHDTDRYDLTVKTAHGTAVIDTTSSHLFWTPYPHYGWIPATHLKPGMHLKTSDGQTAVVVGGSVPAVHDGWMWDLTVPGNNDHDFYVTVATTAVLVHNCGDGTPGYSTRTERAGDLPGKYTQGQSTRDPASQWYHEMLSNDDLLGSINNADEGEGIVVSQEGRIIGGNHRMDELLTRVGDGRIGQETPIMIQVLGDG
jgi:RHS repeat-associated protein